MQAAAELWLARTDLFSDKQKEDLWKLARKVIKDNQAPEGPQDF